MEKSKTILFVDDDLDVLKTAELLLTKAGYTFLAARNPPEAHSTLAAKQVDVVLLDLNFSRAHISGEEGLACLSDIRRHSPGTAVVVVTGHSGLTVAVQALRAGAHNFIMKPWANERLLQAIEDACDNRSQGSKVDADIDSSVIIGESEAIVRARDLVARYAPLTASVLILGKTGTGKSLFGQALHRQSARLNIKVMAAADFRGDGLDDLHDTTLILEGIERLDPSLEHRLLAWLDDVPRNGCRVVATTANDSSEIGLTRSLYYALSHLEITLPPLRERPRDIELLSDHFARLSAIRHNWPIRPIEPDAVSILKSMTWNDNIHALRRTVERVVVAAQGTALTVDDFDLPGADSEKTANAALNLERTEKSIIEEALSRHNFNISKAATELGITRQTLYRRMERHAL